MISHRQADFQEFLRKRRINPDKYKDIRAEITFESLPLSGDNGTPWIFQNIILKSENEFKSIVDVFSEIGVDEEKNKKIFNQIEDYVDSMLKSAGFRYEPDRSGNSRLSKEFQLEDWHEIARLFTDFPKITHYSGGTRKVLHVNLADLIPKIPGFSE